MIVYNSDFTGLNLSNVLYSNWCLDPLKLPNLQIYKFFSEIKKHDIIFYEIEIGKYISWEAALNSNNMFITWSDLICNQDNGILEHIPMNVLMKARRGEAYLIFSQLMEDYMGFDFVSRLSNYLSQKGIPLNKVIYLTNSLNASQLYAEQCSNNGLSPKINVLGVPYFLLSLYNLNREFGTGITEYSVSAKNRTFLCLNRRFRFHRGYFYIQVYRHKLLDHFYFSMDEIDPDQREIVNRNFFSSTAYDFLKSVGDQTNSSNLVDIEQATKLLPLTLDTNTFNYPNINNNDLITYFENSLISVVTETNFSDNVHITEKTFKAIYNLHPFILVSSHHSLKYLRSLGFYTFNNYWDESYDDEPDIHVRMNKIINLIRSISQWDNNRRLSFSINIKSYLEYNKKLLLKTDRFINQYVQLFDSLPIGR